MLQVEAIDTFYGRSQVLFARGGLYSLLRRREAADG